MKNRLPVVLVTGASGFVGRHLTRALARSGWTVRRAVRTSSGSDDEVVIESIGPTTDWQQALAGVHAVVHLAARVHHPQQEHAIELYRNVNIEGTLQLARCAADLGVRELIFVSTVLVHGRSNNSHAPFRESDHLTPRGLYGMSKAAAEAGLKTLAEASDVNITVVRPPLVYGSGAKGNFRVLVKAVRSGFPLPFAGIRNRRAFVAVENLTSFIQYRLSHPAGKFDIFLVADEEQVSTPEFVRRLAAAANASPRLFSVPPLLLSALLTVSSRSEIRESLLGSLQLDLSKAASSGWQPPVSLDEGLRLALRETIPDEPKA